MRISRELRREILPPQTRPYSSVVGCRQLLDASGLESLRDKKQFHGRSVGRSVCITASVDKFFAEAVVICTGHVRATSCYLEAVGPSPRLSVSM